MRLLLPFAVLLLACPLASARADDDADRHGAAQAVLEQLHSADMIGNIVPSIVAQVRLNVTHNDPDLVKQFDAYAPHLRSDAEATRPALMEKLADVYARTFTVEELRDMLAYYKSPVGQRIIAMQGSINHDMLAVARDWGTGIAKAMAVDAAGELQGTKPPAP